jgi:hypothetical protein
MTRATASGLSLRRFRRVFGVDFSGARQPAELIWVAECRPRRNALELLSLRPMSELVEARDRADVLSELACRIGESRDALWGIDFPFALPIEIAPDYREQLQWLADWPGDAYALGRECVRRARQLGPKLHIRRQTDVETKTPFDCYHYRIVCQTFHGMRDVLRPLSREPRVAVIPFDYPRLERSETTAVVVEACPGSTLKRLGLPHNRYKQPTGGRLTAARRPTRATILDGLSGLVAVAPEERLRMMTNPGGDALDAVIAAAGSWQCWRDLDHAAVARHDRYPREGRVFA